MNLIGAIAGAFVYTSWRSFR